MLRTGTRFEQEENGRAQDPFASFEDRVEFEGCRRIYTQIPKQKPNRQPGIGSSVLVETKCLGPVPACDIRPGQKVLTLENGYRRVLWVGREKTTRLNKAIRISPGAVGKARHGKSVIFAVGQNLLLRDPMNELFFGTPDVLARTEYLAHLNGIEVIESNKPREWVHILFDRVEMIQVEGLWVESMVPKFDVNRLAQSKIYGEIEIAVPGLRYEPGFAAYIHNHPVLNQKEVTILTQNWV